MTMLYAQINSQGIHRLEVQQRLHLNDLQNLVGEEGKPALIDHIRHCFCDPTIDLIVDEEFLLKRYRPTCMIGNIIICGQVIGAAVTPDGETIPLTDAQFAIIQQQLRIFVA
jgi:hypothetical protein